MIGNVDEWCQDWVGGYPAGSVTDPQGAVTALARVIRGGYCLGDAWFCRSAQRGGGYPGSPDFGVGFRVLLALGH